MVNGFTWYVFGIVNLKAKKRFIDSPSTLKFIEKNNCKKKTKILIFQNKYILKSNNSTYQSILSRRTTVHPANSKNQIAHFVNK